MKKLILFLFPLLMTVSMMAQPGVKISAMPDLTDASSIDSAYFPVIYSEPAPFTNYKVRGYTVGKARIDSIVNNWPGLMRFGVEDNVAGENRAFNLGNNIFSIYTNTSSEGVSLQPGVFTALAADATVPLQRSSLQLEGNASTAVTVLRTEFPGSHLVDWVAYTDASNSLLQINLGADPQFRITNVPSGTTPYTFYYNNSTGDVTYGPAAGGGGAAGAVYGLNGVSNRNDSTLIWTGTLDQTTDISQVGHPITFHGGTFTHGTGDYITQATDFGISEFGASYLDIRRQVGATFTTVTMGTGATTRVRLEAGYAAGSNVIEVDQRKITLSPDLGNLFVTDLIDSAQSYVLHGNPTNGKVTLHATPAGGSGGTGIQSVEFTNGLTNVSDSAGRLGGALTLTSTTITADSSHNLIFTTNASENNKYAAAFTNSSTGSGLSSAVTAGFGVRSIATSGYGVHTTATTGYGMFAQSTSNNAIFAISTSGSHAIFATNTSGTGVFGMSSTNYGVSAQTNSGGAALLTNILHASDVSTIRPSIMMWRQVTNASLQPLAGMGTSMDFRISAWNGSNAILTDAGRIAIEWTNPNSATTASKYSIYGRTANTETKVMTWTGAGNIELEVAGKGLALKAPDGTKWYGTISNVGVLSWSAIAP